MSSYICIKPCTFVGVTYNKGDAIPSKAVLRSRERVLISQGIIAKANSCEGTSTSPEESIRDISGIAIPIKTNDGWTKNTATPEGISKAIEILQMTAEDAAKEITKLDDEVALILVDKFDTRKSVTAAVEAKLGKIKGDA
jgi:hypothetical protein